MTDKKKNGVYYTPSIITDFASKHLYNNYIHSQRRRISVLEPSVGDGQFASSFVRFNKTNVNSILIDVIDIDSGELQNAREQIINSAKAKVNLSTYSFDFLKFKTNRKYDLIIGNPPYINKRSLTKEQLKLAVSITKEFEGKLKEVKNIWTSFMYKSFQLLKRDGTICQVLPIELLHVNHTSHLREYLISNFKRVEIFTFKEIVFHDTLQDVVLLFASNSSLFAEEGISFYEVDKLDDLRKPDYTKKYFNLHRKKQDKWSNYILTDDEIEFIHYCKRRCKFSPSISYCDKIEVGLVTAANSFFILSEEDVKNKNLVRYSKLIIQKSSQVSDLFEISQVEMDKLIEAGETVHLIEFGDESLGELSQDAVDYIHEGEAAGLDNRFKMRKRDFWYSVPVKWKAEGFFMKRIHKYPKILLNKANVYSTDTMYQIKALPIYDINILAVGFYNVLSFIDCELKGRYYGGGVLELTPNEFKNVEMPYAKLSAKYMKKLKRLLKENQIKKALKENEKISLRNLNKDEINRLYSIYKKLLERRMIR